MSNPTTSPRLRGIVPPLVTPLRGRDELDLPGLARLVEYTISGGVAGIFVLGTTGEGPGLSYRCRYELVERTCELVAGRVPVLVGITDTSLTEALDLAAHSQTCGAAAVVSAPPYYFPQGQAEVLYHFTALAEEGPLPLYLYNMPSHSKTDIELATAEACTRLPNVCGLKDSGGTLDTFEKYLTLRAARPDWRFFIGPERLLAEAVELGGDGGVNGGANFAPRLLVDIFHAAETRDEARLAPLEAQLAKLDRVYRLAPHAGVARGAKCALSLLGICSDFVAPPFTAYGEAERHEIAGYLAEAGLDVRPSFVPTSA